MNKHDRQGLQGSGRNLNTDITTRSEYTRGEETSLSNGALSTGTWVTENTGDWNHTQLSGVAGNCCDHQSSPPALPSWEHKRSTGGWGMTRTEIQVVTTPSLLCTCKQRKLYSWSFIGHSRSHRTPNWTWTGGRGVEGHLSIQTTHACSACFDQESSPQGFKKRHKEQFTRPKENYYFSFDLYFCNND